ncbi:putative ankyrin repeat protein RF_0381 [Cotesia glomerata]|uniref:putative ankyrin repeat protein RF_0381 n=1 Tax=Cotesia glomerata TaxID=32391 RepID=UPI001D00FF7A|nr:putative ankyrin repeat protein RF_0381 [Cotesia glomerata]
MSDDERPAKRQRIDASSDSESENSGAEDNVPGNDHLNDNSDSDMSSDSDDDNDNDNDEDSDDDDDMNQPRMAVDLFRLLAHAFVETIADENEMDIDGVNWVRGTLGDSDEEEEDNKDSDSESQKSESKDTPLIIAVKAENLKSMKQLLKTGVDIDEQGDYFKTALRVAVDMEFIPGIEILLEHGANISAKNTSDTIYNYWDTPLHSAVKKNRLDIVQLLLTKKIDIRALVKNREAVLSHAIKRKNWEIIKCLTRSNSVSINHDNLFRETFKNFSLEQLKELGYGEHEISILFGRYADINTLDESSQTVLFAAVESGNLKIVKYLLEMGADINATNNHQFCGGWTALHIAIDLNNEEIVQHLLGNKHCDVNAKTDKGETPLHVAAAKDNVSVAKKLIKKNAKYDIFAKHGFVSGLTAYHVAVSENALEMVKYFLNVLKVEVNSKTEDGENALQLAGRAKSTEMINLLLDNGININHVNEQDSGQTALHIAIRLDDNELVDLLLRRGADVNILSADGKTALYEAICKKNQYIITRLLDCGADVNKKSSSNRYEGMTAIHQATLQESMELIKLLVNRGADIDATARSNYSFKMESAIDMAIKNNCDGELLQLLLDLGADINEAFVYKNLRDTTSTILQQHVLKLKAAKLHVHKKHLEWISRGIKKREYQSKCIKEVKSMKKEKITRTSVSYYDVLVKGVDQVVMYAENKNIEKAIKDKKLATKFPLYAKMLVYQFKKGQKRNLLLKNAEKKLEDIFGDLPYNCVRDILIYLNNEDLMVYS